MRSFMGLSGLRFGFWFCFFERLFLFLGERIVLLHTFECHVTSLDLFDGGIELCVRHLALPILGLLLHSTLAFIILVRAAESAHPRPRVPPQVGNSGCLRLDSLLTAGSVHYSAQWFSCLHVAPCVGNDTPHLDGVPGILLAPFG